MERFRKYALMSLCSILLAVVVTVFVPMAVVQAENDFTVTEAEGTAVITAESLNVRSGPSKEYDIIGKAKAGEEFAVSGQTDNDWYRIAYDGKEGYVSGKYATVTFSDEKGQNGNADIPDEEMAPIPGLGGVWQKIKAGGFLSVIAFILIPVVLVAIGFTVRSMRSGNEEDDFEDDEYMDDEYAEDEYSEDGEDESSSEADAAWEETAAEEAVAEILVQPVEEPEEIDLREERAREEYLSREVAPFIEEEAALREAERELAAKKEKQEKMHDDESDAELKQAMEKLAELQEEIERIKQKKQ